MGRMSSRLVLLHGFTQRGAIWDVVMDDLRQRLVGEWEIITPDLPGHGDTPIGDDETFWQTADKLADSCGPAHWVGYSLGGRSLLHVAIAHPEVVKSMVLVGAKAGFEDRDEARRRVEADEKIAAKLDAMNDADAFRDWLTNTWLAMPMFKGLQPKDGEDDRRQIDVRLTNDVHNLAKSLRRHGSGVQDFLVPRLHEISIPTTVLWAERDADLIMSDCKVLADAIPNAFGNEVPTVGHSIPWEAPDLFADFVARTIARAGE
jgi:2-succinyl-6-hydroxy-2,4-cyclohexadiene-1-carboxylate synthase